MSDGSVDPHSHEFWAQSNITLKTGEPLTALTVELVVAQTGGVTSTGAWRSLPEEDFTFTVEERDGFLVHRVDAQAGPNGPGGASGCSPASTTTSAATGTRAATATRDGHRRIERLSVRGDFAPRGGS